MARGEAVLGAGCSHRQVGLRMFRGWRRGLGTGWAPRWAPAQAPGAQGWLKPSVALGVYSMGLVRDGGDPGEASPGSSQA